MSSSSQKQTASNSWLSNILRTISPSVTVESCLNLSTRPDPTMPLDARPIVPLIDQSQPLPTRCKHLAVFSELCKSYKFTHLENIFFTVEDILNPSMPSEARHTVFEFMLACVKWQYSELGMARVTFYSCLKNYSHWDDFGDIYQVIFALCKGGRDISGFEKNISKLLIYWLDMAIQKAPPNHDRIPYLSDILELLKVTAKFNFAFFEEGEVTEMIQAAHKAFFSSLSHHHLDDIKACLEFADIVVRYRFVPFDALKPFLEILSTSVILLSQQPKTGISCWPIFLNLLRSHCAHSAILTLCKSIDKPSINTTQNTDTSTQGSIILLSETAWGTKYRTYKKGAESYMVSDSVLLLYFKKAASKGDSITNTALLNALILLIETPENNISLMDWESIWDIVDECTQHVMEAIELQSLDISLFDIKQDSHPLYPFSHFIQTIIGLHREKKYKGPLSRWMNVLYKLRSYTSDETAHLLLTYYMKEHLFLPSTESWIELLQDMANTYYIDNNHHITESTRLTLLDMVMNICTSVKDFYSEIIYVNVVIPMMEKLASETDKNIRHKAIDLIVSSLSDCQNEAIFDTLLTILYTCSRCLCDHGNDLYHKSAQKKQHTLHRKNSSAALIQAKHQFIMDSGGRDGCSGFTAMMGMAELFENLLISSHGTLCVKVFNKILDIANDGSDLYCPFGGPKLVALDLFLRLRCPTNHHIYMVDDNIPEEDSIIAKLRLEREKRKEAEDKKRTKGMYIAGPQSYSPDLSYPSPTIVSYKDSEEEGVESVLDINEMLKSYVRVLSNSPNWVVVIFVLKRLPQQLSNKHLFCGASPYINKLRRRLVKSIKNRNFLENVVNVPQTIKRNDLTIHAYTLLTVLISYRRIFTDPKQDQDEMVYAFYMGIAQVTNATRLCINSLAVCCYEMPLSVTKMLNEILGIMSKIISVSSVSVRILEFLSGLARLPNLYANFTGDMYKPVFAIALNYLQYFHSQQQQLQQQTTSATSSPAIGPPTTSSSTANSHKDVAQGALKQYVLIMAYMVITVWFTAIPLRERRKHVPFIIQRLLSGISMGKPIDEQTFTCIDMLSRFTFADVCLTPEKKSIVSEILMGDHQGTPNRSQQQRTWVYGHTLLTLRTAQSLGWIEVTIRRPSGTMSMMCYIENKLKSDEIDYKTLPALLMMQYQPDLMAAKILKGREEGGIEEDPEEEPEQIQKTVTDILSEPVSDSLPLNTHLRKAEPYIDPGFLYLQLTNYPDTSRVLDITPPLPDDEATARSIATFDRIPVVEFHKIGVLYVGQGQTNELEILANTYGSPDYVRFLNVLGTIQRLRGRMSNLGGLDREMDIDGRYAYFWQDDVTEVVFHVATMMPTRLEHDPQCSAKKRHIGNDYVSIVYNDSSSPYAFNTLPSQFNFINIVISPHSISTESISPAHALMGAENTFFKVEMQTRPDMPDIGLLNEPKLVSAQSLSAFVRQAAIHANTFAQVFWQSSAGGKREYVTHWRERLRQIQRIKERVVGKENPMVSKTGKEGPNDTSLDFTKYT
ncbi:hypothetical protein BDB01DRAFT_800201 [Pilobolus umbonatus]|nr:hypothetical protein BDB01DRAFT_800201 [Pilobolus umbonatus]